ncbi:MAG: hypothetical protein M1819_001530 [Sarea resinae]|nr:MAG: hypothetical protein M1819_001530 [Sarea resinae]
MDSDSSTGQLPDELLLASLDRQYPCRELQIRQVASLLSPSYPSPSTIVLYGLEATGKSAITSSIIQAYNTTSVTIKCLECITGRHLLEKTLASCVEAIEADTGKTVDRESYGKCENISALAVHLQHLLEDRGKFILVLDGIDRQREAPPTLLPALARLGETIPNLTIILIVTYPRARFLHITGSPHIHFPPYTRDESISILTTRPRSIFEDSPPSPSSNYTDQEAAEDSAWVWTRFCGVVWDSLAKGAARDIVSFRAVADKLWQPFVAPIVDETYGTRDFSKLLVAKRGLFQGEGVLINSVVPKESVGEGIKKASTRNTHDLPYYSKYLLCAAYLASYNPARVDPVFFMKSTEKKRRKKGGGTAAASGGRAAKHRKIQRRLLGPQAFVLERMLAIFHAIVPHLFTSTADLLTQIATLASLRLLVRTSATADVLEPATKWRVNVGWEYIHQLARSVKFEIEDHLAE